MLQTTNEFVGKLHFKNFLFFFSGQKLEYKQTRHKVVTKTRQRGKFMVPAVKIAGDIINRRRSQKEKRGKKHCKNRKEKR